MEHKLFNIRQRDSLIAKMTAPEFAMADFSATGEDIPLKQNWAECWCALPKGYEDMLDEVLSYEIRPDDVFVNTYMKCGTTWMQEVAWLLLNNLDFERAKQTNITQRSPNLDGSGIIKRAPSTMEECRQLPSPRLMKSHLSPNLLPKQVWQKKTKIIYVARNVKDCIASAYPFLKALGVDLAKNMDSFVDDFINDDILYSPYLERLADYWRMRDEPNVFFVTYEEMKRDLAGVLQKLCKFLNRPELTPEELEKTVHHLHFDQMKNNKQSHIHDYCVDIVPKGLVSENFTFMRRGIIGSYKDEISVELQQRLDEYTQEILSRYDIEEEDIFGKI